MHRLTRAEHEDERRSGAKSRGLDNFSCPPSRKLGDTYLQSKVRRRDRDGERTARYKRGRERNKRAREERVSEGERRRGCRADAAGCNVTESGAVFVFRCSYFLRVSLCLSSLHLPPFSRFSIFRRRRRCCQCTGESVSVFTRGYCE